MNEESLQRARSVRHLIQIRWVVVLVLFLLHAVLMRSFSLGGGEWRPMLYIIGGYALLNILLRAMLGSRPENAHPRLVGSVAVMGVLVDLGMLSVFAYESVSTFLPYTFAFYILPIIESTVLFGGGAMTLVFVVSLALFGAVAKSAVEGEFLLERLAELLPQGLLLALATLFAWALRRNLAQHAAELSHSRRLTETVVENLSDGILILDTESRALFINRSGETILGMKGSEVLGLKIRTHLSYPIKNIANLLKIVNADSAGSETADVRLEYPQEKLLKVTTTALADTDGTAVGRMFVFRDVSRDAFFNKLKSDFISIAAHQLRTPLSSIKWAFAMLWEGGLGALTHEQRPVVQQGLETTDRLVRLVNSLLNISRIEEGRFGYEFGEVDAATLVAKVTETLRPKAEGRSVRVSAKVPDVLAPLAADPEKIEMVLENLLDNAISYSQSGGEVQLEAAPEGKFLRITVRDNGVGIPKSQQQLLYSKFFRGDNVVRMQTDGSGLGLYIAKNIVERHGGSISLTSEEGVGTTVSFTVPFAR